jgi:hypothetical protein
MPMPLKSSALAGEFGSGFLHGLLQQALIVNQIIMLVPHVFLQCAQDNLTSLSQLLVEEGVLFLRRRCPNG